MKIAIIDLGSNSARMTVWCEQNGEISELFNDRKYVRLSEGLSENNLLGEVPMRRTLCALSGFRKTIDSLNCDTYCAVATEAVRRAENGGEFIRRAKAECNIDIRILTGEEEAVADFHASLDMINSDALITDVGGGSLEMIASNQNGVLFNTCMPLGAVVTTDMLGGSDLSKLITFFEDEFSRIFPLDGFFPKSIIGLGGSIRALFDWTVGKKQGALLTRDDFFAHLLTLSATTESERSRIAAFSERADIILAGLAPFAALFNLTNAENIILNNRGVREGLLLQCLKSK